MDTNKRAKKSKHGKKNWRKNIDVTEIESKIKLKNKEEIIESKVKGMKDNDLFTVDYSKGTEKFIGKKRGRPQKKASVVEQRRIKRMIASNENNKQPNMIKEEGKEEIVDLWADEEITGHYSKTKRRGNSLIRYPVVPIPHPGQSYNPSKDDLSKLLYKVVELNNPLGNKIIKEEKQKGIVKEDEDEDDNEEEEEPEEEKEEEEDYDDDDSPCTHPVSNNPPTLDNRLSRKEKKRKELVKAHILREKQAIKMKQVKIDISNAKSSRKLEKERKKVLETEARLKAEKESHNKKLQSQYSHGIIDE